MVRASSSPLTKGSPSVSSTGVSRPNSSERNGTMTARGSKNSIASSTAETAMLCRTCLLRFMGLLLFCRGTSPSLSYTVCAGAPKDVDRHGQTAPGVLY